MKPVFDAINSVLMSKPSDCQRVFHGRGHCYPGLEWLTVDWYQPVLWVCLFKNPENQWLNAFKRELLKCMSLSKVQGITVMLQHRYLKGAPAELLFGTETRELITQENGLKFKVRFGGQQNTGLFLDMAKGRQWVKENSQGASVLNLFAYTCGFSVAAVAGAAERVVNVDMSKAALSWGRDNHRLNHHSLDKVKFFAHDVLRSWGKLKKLGPYDLVIVDPPSYQKGSFIAKKDYGKMARRVEGLLNPGGVLLACLNAPELDTAFLHEAMGCDGLVFERRLSNPDGFPESDPEKGLKALVFTKS